RPSSRAWKLWPLQSLTNVDVGRELGVFGGDLPGLGHEDGGGRPPGPAAQRVREVELRQPARLVDRRREPGDDGVARPRGVALQYAGEPGVQRRPVARREQPALTEGDEHDPGAEVEENLRAGGD